MESCEVEKDICSFVQEKGTGQEIPDPPRYINFCRGELNDTASEASEDDSYSVAQFQRTINPAFRSSSPQPSIFESHHDPKSDLAMQMGHQEEQTPPCREKTMTPQKSMQPPPKIDYRRQAQVSGQIDQGHLNNLATVPHNEYPTDGMTMFCRTAPPSERSSVASPIRPSSRDSRSDYSNPTSFSSQEPPSGKQSPIKQGTDTNSEGSPSRQLQKKRSGFFSNSPFRRKSKSERNGRDQGGIPVFAPPASRTTWSPAAGQEARSVDVSPTRSYGQRPPASSRENYADSPEPVDPRANFQLNVGPNVFDVASPDSGNSKTFPNSMKSDKVDPLVQALAELKGINKQSSVRMSADRYHGIATPAPPGTPNLPTASSRHKDHSAGQFGTPPPSYQDPQPVKRLDLPQPAFTSKQMHETTRKYVNQNQNMYGSSSKPMSKGNVSNVPRSASPLPVRSISPRPSYNPAQGGGHGGYAQNTSPNPSNPQSGTGYSRQEPRGSPSKSSYGNGAVSGSYSRHGSPNEIQRAVSPQPQSGRQERPSSSMGTMALQLADANSAISHKGRGGGTARPVSYYGGHQPPNVEIGRRDGFDGRTRSKSVTDGMQYTKDGRPILQFGKFWFLPLGNHDASSKWGC